MTLAEDASIDVRGCKINVRRSGKGEPLLFLHGAMGLGEHEPGLEALSAAFEVIAPDLPGFGQSDIAGNVSDARDLSLFTLDLIDALKLDKIHVVGQCLGGWVALEMAVHSSHRMKSMTLVNSAGIRVKGVPRGDMFLCSEADLLKLLFAGNGAEAWMQDLRASPDLEGIYERNRAAAAKFTWSPRLCNPRLDRWLHRVNTPTHIVWGADNRVIPAAYAMALKELIRGATTSIIADCAHLLHIEKPTAFASEVTQIIRRTAP